MINYIEKYIVLIFVSAYIANAERSIGLPAFNNIMQVPSQSNIANKISSLNLAKNSFKKLLESESSNKLSPKLDLKSLAYFRNMPGTNGGNRFQKVGQNVFKNQALVEVNNLRKNAIEESQNSEFDIIKQLEGTSLNRMAERVGNLVDEFKPLKNIAGNDKFEGLGANYIDTNAYNWRKYLPDDIDWRKYLGNDFRWDSFLPNNFNWQANLPQQFPAIPDSAINWEKFMINGMQYRELDAVPNSPNIKSIISDLGINGKNVGGNFQNSRVLNEYFEKIKTFQPNFDWRQYLTPNFDLRNYIIKDYDVREIFPVNFDWRKQLPINYKWQDYLPDTIEWIDVLNTYLSWDITKLIPTTIPKNFRWKEFLVSTLRWDEFLPRKLSWNDLLPSGAEYKQIIRKIQPFYNTNIPNVIPEKYSWGHYFDSVQSVKNDVIGASAIVPNSFYQMLAKLYGLIEWNNSLIATGEKLWDTDTGLKQMFNILNYFDLDETTYNGKWNEIQNAVFKTFVLSWFK